MYGLADITFEHSSAVQVAAEFNGSVNQEVSDNSNYISTITNTSTSSTAKGLLLQLGNRTSTSGRFIGFADTSGTVSGYVRGGASVAYVTSGADFAEYFKANPNQLPEAGDIVSIDKTKNQTVSLASDTTVVPVGVISANPGFIGNGPVCDADDTSCESNYSKYNVLVGLVGQVPVKVVGTVNIGDPIMISSIPGVGQSAVATAPIVGYALSSYKPGSEDNTTVGQVMVSIAPQMHVASLQGGGVSVASLRVDGDTLVKGDLKVEGMAQLASLRVTGLTELAQLKVERITSSGALPVVAALEGSGSNGELADQPQVLSAIKGNDIAGVVTVKTGLDTVPGEIIEVTFNKQYDTTPVVNITPSGKNAALIRYYISSVTESGFVISAADAPAIDAEYQYQYQVIE
jgi:hypothetical protein